MQIELYSDEYFMRKALDEASIALEKDEVPVGAVVVVNNKIIGRGYNMTQALIDVTAHAEMQAITAASSYLGSKYLKDCTLFVTLEPCSMCTGALYWSQMGRVVYAADDEKRGSRIMGGNYHPKTKVERGLMSIESQEMLHRFFKSKR